MLGIVAICDARNTEPKHGLKPLMIGLLVVAIGATYGYNCGYAINPARDFGPRLVYQLLPRKNKHADWAYSWVPILGPFTGGTIAGLIYSIL